MGGQFGIDPGVVGGQQLVERLVLLDGFHYEAQGFFLERSDQRGALDGRKPVLVVDQPARGKAPQTTFGARVGQQPLHLRGDIERARIGGGQQVIVRRRDPEGVGQQGRNFVVGQTVEAGVCVCHTQFRAVHKVGRHQQRLYQGAAGVGAVVEVRVSTYFVV